MMVFLRVVQIKMATATLAPIPRAARGALQVSDG
jgi:hypothetical protein